MRTRGGLAALCAAAAVLAAALGSGCAGDDKGALTRPAGAPPDRQALVPVALPDLSRVAESVRDQLRESHAALTRTMEHSAATAVDLGNAYGSLGSLLMAAEFLDAAEPCYRNARLLAPDDARWPYYLGHLYKNKGDPASAAKSFEETLRLRPSDAPTMVWLGNVYLDQNRPAAAEPLFAKALSIQPRSVAALFGLGRAALARHDYVRAAEQMEEALALDQRASIIHYPLAMAYRGLGDLEKAELHLRRRSEASVSTPDPLMLELGGLVESAAAYEIRGIGALERGQWPDAAAHFRRGVELEPGKASLRHRLATALFLQGDAAAAMEQLQEVLRLAPDFAKAHYSLGVILASNGRMPEAIERFSAAVRYDPDYVEARLVLADTLRGNGRPEASLAHYERVLATDPRVAEARLGHALALVRLGRHREARNRLAEDARIHPDRAEFAYALARVLAAAPEDRVRDGRRALEIMQALPEDQRRADFGETMAMAFAEAGRYEDAAAWQRDAIAEAARSGNTDLAASMAGNLKLYEAGRPSRTPWRRDELP